MLQRSRLIAELTASPEAFGKVKAFYGKTRQPRRDILKKPENMPTSDGIKTVGTGNSKNPAKKSVRRWTSGSKGELRTRPGAPTNLNNIKPAIPRDVFRRVFAHVNLERTALLVDHHDGG